MVPRVHPWGSIPGKSAPSGPAIVTQAWERHKANDVARDDEAQERDPQERNLVPMHMNTVTQIANIARERKRPKQSPSFVSFCRQSWDIASLTLAISLP